MMALEQSGSIFFLIFMKSLRNFDSNSLSVIVLFVQFCFGWRIVVCFRLLLVLSVWEELGELDWVELGLEEVWWRRVLALGCGR